MTNHFRRASAAVAGSRSAALAIVLGYAAFAASWILVSDKAVAWLFHDSDTVALVSTLKGWLFVVLTSVLLFAQIRRLAPSEGPETGGAAPVSRILLVVLAMTVAIVGVGMRFTFVQARDEGVAKLRGVAERKASQVGLWLRDRLDDARLLQRTLAPGNPALPSRLQEWLGHGQVRAISLLDAHASTLWRTDNAPDVLSAAVLEAARRAADAREPAWTGPAIDADGRASLDVVVPLVAGIETSRLIVLHVDPTVQLYPNVVAWSEASASGEAVLTRRNGDRLQYLSALRFGAGAATPREPPAPGSAGADGEAERIDYRGVAVFEVTRPVAGADWSVAAKIDRAELYQRAVSDRLWMALAGVLSAVVVGIGIHALSQHRQKRIAIQTAALIAHDLNQPLAALSAYSEAARRMLRDGARSPEKLTQAIEAGAVQAMRAGRSLHELMEFLQRGDIGADAPALLDLNAVVRETVAAMQDGHPGAFHPEFDLQANLPAVHGNQRQVEKVLVNLIRNAIEAMGSGNVPAASAVVRIKTATHGRSACVTVQDSGPGVQAGAASRVFEAFFTTKTRGLGIGLAVSRALVESHGGRLWHDRSAGPGAVFHFTLPFAA